MMSSDNKALVRRAYEVIGQGDFDALGALIADDMVEHEHWGVTDVAAMMQQLGDTQG